MPSLTHSTRMRATPDQVSSELGKEVVILHVQNGVYYGLNEVGMVIWRRLQAGSTVADIITKVLEEFDVSRQQCEEDVLRILSEMLDAKLAVIEASTGPPK